MSRFKPHLTKCKLVNQTGIIKKLYCVMCGIDPDITDDALREEIQQRLRTVQTLVQQSNVSGSDKQWIDGRGAVAISDYERLLDGYDLDKTDREIAEEQKGRMQTFKGLCKEANLNWEEGMVLAQRFGEELSSHWAYEETHNPLP